MSAAYTANSDTYWHSVLLKSQGSVSPSHIQPQKRSATKPWADIHLASATEDKKFLRESSGGDHESTSQPAAPHYYEQLLRVVCAHPTDFARSELGTIHTNPSTRSAFEAQKLPAAGKILKQQSWIWTKMFHSLIACLLWFTTVFFQTTVCLPSTVKRHCQVLTKNKKVPGISKDNIL